MPPSPSLLLAMIIVLAIALSAVMILLGLIWSRLCRIPLDRAARLADDLGPDPRDLKSRLSRVEIGAEESPRRAPAPAPSRASSPSLRADAASASAVVGPTLIAVPNLSAPTTQAAMAVAAELGRRFGAIWEMADSGSSAEAIARESGQPIGQVELILALRRQLAAGPGSRV